MIKNIYALSFCIVFGATFSQSRRFYDNNDYKRQRHELNFGLGVSSCQTDVGGSQYSEQELVKNLEEQYSDLFTIQIYPLI